MWDAGAMRVTRTDEGWRAGSDRVGSTEGLGLRADG